MDVLEEVCERLRAAMWQCDVAGLVVTAGDLREVERMLRGLAGRLAEKGGD